MRICLVLEGCYPYVHGGVSTWMHGYIQAMPEHEFVLWVIGAHAADRGKFVYELPGNVVEVHEVFLDDALRLSGEQEEADFTTASARRCAAWCRFLIRTGTCYLISSSAVACIRYRFCRAARLWISFATCAWPSTHTRPLPMHSTPCAPCCCPCSTFWAARCRWPMCTTPSRPATAACSPVWAQAFTRLRCC